MRTILSAMFTDRNKNNNNKNRRKNKHLIMLNLYYILMLTRFDSLNGRVCLPNEKYLKKKQLCIDFGILSQFDEDSLRCRRIQETVDRPCS